MEQNARTLAVGIFTTIFIVMLAGFVIWLGSDSYRSDHASYDIIFDESVSGLSTASDVEFNGLKVGKVAQIALDPATRRAIRVRIEILPEIRILHGDRAVLESRGLTGVAYIQIHADPKRNTAPIETVNGNKLPIIPTRPSTFQRLYEETPQVLGEVGILLHRLTSFFEKNEDNISMLTNNINQLSIRAGVVADEVLTVLQKTETVIDGFEKTPEEFNNVLSSVQNLLDKDIPTLAENLNGALSTIDGVGNRISRILEQNEVPINQVFTRTAPQFGTFLRETQALIQILERLLTKIERDPAGFFLGR